MVFIDDVLKKIDYADGNRRWYEEATGCEDQSKQKDERISSLRYVSTYVRV